MSTFAGLNNLVNSVNAATKAAQGNVDMLTNSWEGGKSLGFSKVEAPNALYGQSSGGGSGSASTSAPSAGGDTLHAGVYNPSRPSSLTYYTGPNLADQAAKDKAALKKSTNKANKANEARYQEILGLYENLGTAGMERIGQQEGRMTAASEQDLTNRGLGNTTIRGSMARGIADDAELQRQGLRESVAMQKAGVMERKTDAAPDLSMYMNLLSQSMSRPTTPTGIRYY